jgi:hypothetical protein
MRDYSSLFGTVKAGHAGQAAMGVIDSAQRHPAPVQAVGVALAFVLMMKHLGTHPGDVLSVAQNILDSDLQHQPEIRAVREYVKKEIR